MQKQNKKEFMVKTSLVRMIQFIVYLSLLSQLIGCNSIYTNRVPESSGIIDSDNPNIQYIGRFDHSDPKNVQFDWPGVYISAIFEGTSCSIRLSDSTNEYSVVIDQNVPRLLKVDTSKIYSIAKGLIDSIPHKIVIQKRTEAFVGRGGFQGFILDKGRKLKEPENRPARRIEFIGNSITCGYGVEGDSANCQFSVETENANMSYASMTARALSADYALIAYSGKGVVRNYGDSNKTSIDPMPHLYDRTCFSDSLKLCNYSKWIPQVVVVNLGTNDFSTKPFPDKANFQQAYRRLLNHIREVYTGVTIFCICGPMIEEPCMSYIKEIVQQEKSKSRDRDVFFVGIKRDSLTDADWGCDYHPNVYGMVKISNILVSEIKMRMNW
jgi:lysophospholipase L1-like esterase